MTQATLIYVGDPMCSWCYGFGPQLQTIHRALGGRVAMQIILGGLRPYTTAPMDDRLRDHLRFHWYEVAARSGLPFNYDILARKDFVYDTEPACRAVVAARLLQPELALPCFLAVQDAFYRDGRDITSGPILAEVAGEVGLDRQAFAAEFDSDIARQATRHNFLTAQNMGVRAFPSLLLHRDAAFWWVCRGYAEAGPLLAAIERGLA